MKTIVTQMGLVVFSFLYSLNSFAQIPSKLLQEIVPSRGTLIKVVDDRVLIDLDSKSGVREGDLFTIFSPGEPITHPVTRKIVAILENKVGVVKVVAVRDGYSIAKRISGSKEPSEGFRVEKFTELRVLYLDYADNRKLYDELKVTFPNMEWETYEKGLSAKSSTSSKVTGPKGYDLYVAVEKDMISLYDGQLDRIREYSTSEPDAKVIRRGISRDTATAKSIVELKGTAGQYKNLFSVNQTVRSMDGRKIYGVPHFILAADESVVLYKYESGRMEKLATIRDFVGEPISVYLEDLDSDGRYEIVVNSYDNGSAYTTVYSVRGVKVSKLTSSMPFFTALYDTDGDGTRETKLIQYVEGERFWGRIEQVTFQDGAFQKTGGVVQVPQNFHILGGFIADIDGDGNLESGYFSPSGSMLVYRGNKHLWTSPGKPGGSIISVPYKVGSGEFNQMTYVAIYQPPVVLDFNGDKSRKIVMARNAIDGYNVIASFPSYSSGYISYLGKSETGLRVIDISAKIDAAVQNIVAIDKEIIFTAVNVGSFSGKGESSLLSFPLE